GGYFVNDYIEFAGAVNIAKEEKKGIYSKERVIMANPDVIIITTMGMAGEAEKKNWEQFPALSAVKSKRIYIINTEKLTSPTPASFVETLEELVAILHPWE
ncbi:MAG: cobalamide ABC transporter substrate-binding protein, partial [Candidatus Omnitrophota bacterium]